MSEEQGSLQTPAGPLAFRRRPGLHPGVMFFGGFGSDMSGTKAQALDDWAAKAGRAFLRFDYSGHGASGGDFAKGTITQWRADALAMIDEKTRGPLILTGSSMGAWIACLAAMARPERVAGLVLIAPAPDFATKLMIPNLPDEAHAALASQGVWRRAGEIPVHRAMLDDAARWEIMPGPIPIDAPVRIIQGGRDELVPWPYALEFAQALNSQDVVFTLIKDGDHRLSRPADLTRMIAAVEELVAAFNP